MALTDKLTAIGDAIREKTGSTAKLTLDQMVDEIEGISGGGVNEAEIGLLEGGLESYTNDRVTTVGKYSFYNSTVKHVSFPNATAIGNSAFQKCANLLTIDVPNVNNLQSGGIFKECTSLTSISLPKVKSVNSGGSMFATCTSLVDVDLPIVADLGSMSCFQGCTALKKLDLPSATAISGGTVFSGCTSFETLILRNTTNIVTLSGSNNFTNTVIAAGTGSIYVPDDLVESYKAATNWATYADQIKPLSEYVEVTE